ncbi:class I SAM-dependent methyltransferase [Aromatoleum bremense]|uniref:class I SAM-dependent methyltransferase n=1 Tax=Aromatoleum bremense TaxID=76115 RepID=UPI001AEBCD62|nr:class I SAM-dependent methyltransferase [Aromatoleum bremense]QTQ32128.1 Putative phospholipid methyltransferase [Aromatoleum bremense]
MRIYERWILPRLIDLAMRNREVRRYRARVVPQARGWVLEIGIGSGLNLPHYGAGVQRLYGLDPSGRLLAMTGKRVSGAHFPVELINCGAEAILLADGSMDAVVTTFTLCSVTDPLQALREMRPGCSSRTACCSSPSTALPRSRVCSAGNGVSHRVGAASPAAVTWIAKWTR